MSLFVNTWLAQMLLNVYHTVAEERSFILEPVRIAEPRLRSRDKIRCELVSNRIQSVQCNSYPLRVVFEQGCAVVDESQESTDHADLWARNCTPHIVL
jgi:hypothetical protein